MSEGLQRFKDAQKDDFETALSEIKAGKKRSHWMWYIFPQIHGLGMTGISRFYSIQSIKEAVDFMKDPVLGERLIEISSALLDLETDDPYEVFGSPDYLKLLSCMTLFEKAAPDEEVFARVIDKFYGGRRDQKTLEILKNEAPAEIADRKIYNTDIGPVCMSKTEHEAYEEEKALHGGGRRSF
ncbi:MAG: DUF1810 domain-containing protein [Lachnospiraceae bacterium]|uniref:DUF1810 domain-containing protein n=1 Tax=Candidatus Weimeria bifida TaxID=2599074 RepID=A0A6N7IWP3_9FIRM|nr:DUF1810 domain-containing protein [Candidatus Weimeria bifida]RRF95764.1 MAG: DUF1810 domain-containing protein [Lachnospiraceae bacterium]